MNFAVETINLSKSFPAIKGYSELFLYPFRKNYTNVINDITINVKKGELFALLGPNGAGKTTLIKILCTLILPTSGQAFVNGYDIIKHQKFVKRSVGFVSSDERSFYWRLTGRQNLIFYATLNNLTVGEYEKRIKLLISLLQLEKEADNKFKDYSTGTKQKFAIARGLLTNPDILFLDEPTRSLDPAIANKLNYFIKNQIVGELKKTVVFATHNLTDAEQFADCIAIIHNGKIDMLGSPSEMQDYPHKMVYHIRIDNPEQQLQYIKRSLPLNGQVMFTYKEENILEITIMNKHVSISDVISKIVENKGKIRACKKVKRNLFDIYNEVVK